VSLALEMDDVVAVLLADGWHDVENHSFELDAYEFKWEAGWGEDHYVSGMCSTGFGFRENGLQIAGPLTAVLAVRLSA